jgi:hypothetical protein
MSDLARLRELSNTACIVGVDESDEIARCRERAAPLHVQITNAARGAGIKVSEIDRIFTAGQTRPRPSARRSNVRATWTARPSGCSFIIMVSHAMVASTRTTWRSCHGNQRWASACHRGAIRYPGPIRFPTASVARPPYGLITTRHMHEYGTTPAVAQVAIRRGRAMLNPKARNRGP